MRTSSRHDVDLAPPNPGRPPGPAPPLSAVVTTVAEGFEHLSRHVRAPSARRPRGGPSASPKGPLARRRPPPATPRRVRVAAGGSRRGCPAPARSPCRSRPRASGRFPGPPGARARFPAPGWRSTDRRRWTGSPRPSRGHRPPRRAPRSRRPGGCRSSRNARAAGLRTFATRIRTHPARWEASQAFWTRVQEDLPDLHAVGVHEPEAVGRLDVEGGNGTRPKAVEHGEVLGDEVPRPRGAAARTEHPGRWREAARSGGPASRRWPPSARRGAPRRSPRGSRAGGGPASR